MSTKGLRHAGLTALAYIEAHPGCTILAVDKARRTARGGHQWMYRTVHRTVHRLIARGAVRAEFANGRYSLFAIA